ncbi:hydroxymethylpyrimidine/phosphomethylpyrimidine kinase [Nitrospirillum amazonense]|uniref:hydroxymethylpyrimidine kinase n=1 Tax=Nitrospirillum amazonense TaxID=28077 RepID=A0A560JRC4_9PROT|nr:bifunctional hydroxymethylpyrimidine kinase/phosphomethylpyrimidine kinase [Nitrospirillum amazonense]TWB73536.1 hydroxymethylpyrimidine/phosphomethylpyrimidine kinase [Nitrospirillum amazonense]
MRGRVLIVAGSDSGGGAGIQADIKAVTALGGYAMTAVTALTAQDTHGVQAVMPVPPEFIALQMRLCLADIGADAVKTGMLASAEVIETVAEVLSEVGVPALVVDPVMAAKGGQRLLEDRALSVAITRLLPITTLLTPNTVEAAALTGLPLESFEGDSLDGMRRAADRLLDFGTQAVLIKGGHRAGPVVTDLLVTRGGEHSYSAPRFDSVHTHGTGCTLASAIACGLAQGLAAPQAVERAHAYVQAAIRTAPGFGGGHGPLNHTHTVRPFP